MANNNVQPQIISIPGEVLLSSFKTTEDLVRFSASHSAVSKLWKTSPFIDIDVIRRQIVITEYAKEKFEKFVNRVITEGDNYNLDLVKLNCRDFVRVPKLAEWIHKIIERNAKEVNLSFRSRDGEVVSLPDCLLCCDELSLCLLGDTLGDFNICQQPHSGTKKVKLLKLNNVELSDSVLGSLLNMCESLKHLRLVDCFSDQNSLISISCPRLESLVVNNHQQRPLCEKLVIECPNLLLFEYRGQSAFSFFEVSKVCANNLKTVIICPQELFDPPFEDGEFQSPSLYNMLLEVSKAESLEINHCFLKFLYGYYEGGPGVVYSFKTLIVKTKFDMPTLNVLIEILKGCQNLESLELTIEEVCPSILVLDSLRSPVAFGEEMTILTRCLKRAVFLGLEMDAVKKVRVAELLLAHACELESMVFSWDDQNMYEDRASIMLEVNAVNRASPSAELFYMLSV